MFYWLARDDARLRARIKRTILTASPPLPHFWLAAFSSLVEPVEFNTGLPAY